MFLMVALFYKFKIMNEIKIGIWLIHESGIECAPVGMPEGHIGKGAIWATIIIANETVWDLPIHFAYKDWQTEKDLVDLIRAMAIFRKLNPQPERNMDHNLLDAASITRGLSIIRNRENPGRAA